MGILKDSKEAAREVVGRVGNKIVLATPLGAGKPNTFLNSMYDLAKNDSSIDLTILTALTLQKPAGKSDLEKRFLAPLAERVFGNYPDLHYELDRVSGNLPENIKVIEFYFPPGKFVGNSEAQQNYLSTNYTHAARDVLGRGVNVVCQQVCKGEVDGQEVYSLSCNPEITIDIADSMRANDKNAVVVAQVNQDLPFMYGESIVGNDYFDVVLDNRDLDFKVFGPPKMSVSDADYLIGLHASTLVKDDGEIQIGIGSLGDAIVYSLCLREENNDLYKSLLSELNISGQSFPIIEKDGDFNKFKAGLFAATEMFVDCFSSLYRSNILKKKVYDSIVLQRLLNNKKITEEIDISILSILYKEQAISNRLTSKDVSFLKEFGIFDSDVLWSESSLKYREMTLSLDILDSENLLLIEEKILGMRLRNGAVAHAGFFLGPRDFYQFLKDLPIEERKLIRMKKISNINQLFGHEEIDRLQRKNGRFINTCMKVTLNGSACSDALENGSQVSGVGGQFNFVVMAHELPDARSILQLRSFRIDKNGNPESNIVFNYGNCTIPRHLRDVVITEYGIADLRGKTDEEVAIELIHISDSRFQEDLLSQSKRKGKVRDNYKIPERFANNFPQSYQKILKKYKMDGFFEPFPFGTDFTAEELKIGKVLKHLKSLSLKKINLVKYILSSFLVGPCPEKYEMLLERMNLLHPSTFKEKLYRNMLVKGFLKLL